ncbi:uncharacterized protein GGS25DRAFT_512843 [Hypoxylon fragiforme]|uniref:uncharacterized protein n=1 Tax=Hypoxylon fragiforme TaxID=63214 RepID=UPI0020C69346|nr:uncharacterized protein GGS25DRAFT_512843 [Hypoxylon fragiforme]KAI2612310.1 hypothetical protein GGS25DRAFT_512843 [Hypoxylon fragiforme]
MAETVIPMVQSQRQRKFHRRSRNGCSTCKTKHIRCDERKPLCTYCLRHGGECGYPDEENAAEARHRLKSRMGSGEPHESTEPCQRLVGTSLNDQFLGTSYDVPYRSRSLFQLFTNTRVLYTTRVKRNSNSFIVHKALSHPGFLHAALLMTALHWAWSTGDVEHSRVPYLYHKLQAIRFVTDQLINPDAAIHDGTIAAVSSLALVENALGSVDAVSSHLRGLAKIKELQDKERRPKKMGLLQRMILMAARSVSSRPVWDILDISRTDFVHQSMIISLLRVALRPIYSLYILGGSYDSGELLSEVLAKKAPQARDSNALAPPRSLDCSRSGFMACYFYLYIIMREGTVDSFILNWFIEQLLTDVCRTETPMQKGQYSQSLWFWSAMFGACATMAAKTTDDLERNQMNVVRDIYLDKINLGSQVLRIKNWETAKSILRLFAWEDDFDGELEMKAVWEEAVWEDDRRRFRRRSPENTEYQDTWCCW